MSEVKVPCEELGCDKCCRPTTALSGGMVGKSEMKPLVGLTEEIQDRQFIKKSNGKCSQLVDGKCAVYMDRPAVCRYHPFSLYEDKLTVSLTCTWVHDVLLPKWGGEEGVPEEQLEAFRKLRMEMIDSVPEDIKGAWNEDKKSHSVKIILDVGG